MAMSIVVSEAVLAGASLTHFNFFLGRANFFFIFQSHRTIEKLEKRT
jgi:hypothetical protein